ncbi:hypothetical protein MTO96_019161 [Rhipicephalus appendiculatus]
MRGNKMECPNPAHCSYVVSVRTTEMLLFPENSPFVPRLDAGEINEQTDMHQRGRALRHALSPLGGDSFCPPRVVRTGSAHGPAAAVGDPPALAAGQRSLRLADASLCPVSSLGKGPATLSQAERAQHNARNCASSHAALPLVAAMVLRETAVPVCIALSSCSDWHHSCCRPPVRRYARTRGH